MISLDSLMPLIQAHGLWLFFPIAVVEGPIATVIAAYLARLGYLDLRAIFLVAVLADLVGDSLYYGLGHGGLRLLPLRWRAKLRLTPDRLESLVSHFEQRGGRTLVTGKLTHSVGVAVLVAAGMARMRFVPFLMYNLIGTIPKILVLMFLGYTLGYAYATIDSYIFKVSIALFIAVVALGIWWFMRKRKKP